MEREKFSKLFLFVAFLIFIGTNRNIYSSIILILASLFMLVDTIIELWKEIKKHASR